MILNKEQAQLIAECVTYDIKDYINKHLLEYEKWKNELKKKEVTKQ